MTTSTAIPTARQRKSRTRTTNVSSKPALLLSQLPPTMVQLTHRAEVLACPACETWCPLTLNKGTKQWKIAPHHTERAGTPGARRCGNSNRLFIIDMPLAVWQEQRVEASADVAARRPTKVLKKVKTPVVPAVTQLAPAAPTADTARETYEAHRKRCSACTGRAHCIDGGRLAATYLQLLRQEPQRRAAQARAEQEQRRAERRQAEQHPQRRADEWRRRLPAVFVADTLRRIPLRDAVGPIRGIEVPTEKPSAA